MKNNKKKKKSLKELFAYGGTAMNVDTPSEDIAKMQLLTQQALAESQADPTVAGLRMLGKTMTNTGMSMVSQGFSQSGQMDGIGGFLQSNWGDISTGVNALNVNMATGGTTRRNTEVEGQEAFELPNGLMGKFSGPSHEKGGIDVNLPPGTDIYSKRIKVNGEKMADRKIFREKQLSKLEKLMERNPHDKNLRDTYSKVKADYDILDEKDMMIQNTLHNVSQTMQRAYGGTVDDEEDNYINQISGLISDEDEEDTYYDEEEAEMQEEYEEDDYALEEDPYAEEEEDDYFFEDEEEEEDEEFLTGGTTKNKKSKKEPIVTQPIIPPVVEIPEAPILPFSPRNMDGSLIDSVQNQYFDTPIEMTDVEAANIAARSAAVQADNNGVTHTTSGERGILGNYSYGDVLGMAGSLYGAFSGRSNTMKNRATDTPNINPYKEYGQEGLKTIDSMFDNLDFSKKQALQDLELGRNSMLSRARNSARGVNTLRAMNLAADSSVNNSKSKVYSDHANKINSILGIKSNAQNQKDRMVMQGEYMRDMNDRRDKDNFYTQLGIDNQSIATGIQQFGKQMNTSVERDMTAQALEYLSKYFGVDISATGFNLTNKKQ